MTTGIYSLYWENENLTYIGQSHNIEIRYNSHLSKLRLNKHSNYKVQKAYNLYGNPQLSILEETTIDNLANREVFWTNEFNSLDPFIGLNIVAAGNNGAGWGTLSSRSEYSKIQVLRVFSLLYHNNLSHKEISAKTLVSESAIKSIKRGGSHSWLKLEYPDKYQMMISSPKKYSRTKKDITRLLSPDGKIHLITSITEFCKSIKELNDTLAVSRSKISEVISGNRKSHKGWKLHI